MLKTIWHWNSNIENHTLKKTLQMVTIIFIKSLWSVDYSLPLNKKNYFAKYSHFVNRDILQQMGIPTLNEFFQTIFLMTIPVLSINELSLSLKKEIDINEE